MDELRITPASDRSLLVTLGSRIAPDVHRRVRKFCGLLEESGHHAIQNLHPAYASVLIAFDPRETCLDDFGRYVESLLPGLDSAPLPLARRIEIPVCYAAEFAPDLGAVAALCGLAPAEVIWLHSSAEYFVYFLGFSPGFAYLGGLPESINAPRLPESRRAVPAGSVAIGGSQTGIYPAASPGGWRLIGRTPLRLFSPENEMPALLDMGDEVRFVPITSEEFTRLCR
jgi:inhibitor of KinA